MPSRSWDEHRFWEAAKHDPKFAKKAGISPKVAKEFTQADDAEGITGNKRSLPARAKKKAKRK